MSFNVVANNNVTGYKALNYPAPKPVTINAKDPKEKYKPTILLNQAAGVIGALKALHQLNTFAQQLCNSVLDEAEELTRRINAIETKVAECSQLLEQQREAFEKKEMLSEKTNRPKVQSNYNYAVLDKSNMPKGASQLYVDSTPVPPYLKKFDFYLAPGAPPCEHKFSHPYYVYELWEISQVKKLKATIEERKKKRKLKRKRRGQAAGEEKEILSRKSVAKVELHRVKLMQQLEEREASMRIDPKLQKSSSDVFEATAPTKTYQKAETIEPSYSLAEGKPEHAVEPADSTIAEPILQNDERKEPPESLGVAVLHNTTQSDVEQGFSIPLAPLPPPPPSFFSVSSTVQTLSSSSSLPPAPPPPPLTGSLGIPSLPLLPKLESASSSGEQRVNIADIHKQITSGVKLRPTSHIRTATLARNPTNARDQILAEIRSRPQLRKVTIERVDKFKPVDVGEVIRKKLLECMGMEDESLTDTFSESDDDEWD